MSERLKLTEWFAPEVTPVREGVYEIDWNDDSGRCFAMWFGDYWGRCRWEAYAESTQDTIDKAASSTYGLGDAGNKRWRGLALDPASSQAAEELKS